MPSVAVTSNTYSCALAVSSIAKIWTRSRHLGVDVDREGDIALGLQLLHLIKYFEGRTELESEAADDVLAVEQQKRASVDLLDGIKRCQSCYPCQTCAVQ